MKNNLSGIQSEVNVRLMSWNVHLGVSTTRTPMTANVIASWILRHGATIVCLQEVPRKAWAESVAACLGRHWSVAYLELDALTKSGNAILTLLNTSNAKVHKLLFDDDGGMQTCIPWRRRGGVPRRGALMLELADVNLSVVCTHFSADVLMCGQFRQVKQLHEWITGHAAHFEHEKRLRPPALSCTIMAGDLNAHSVSPVLKWLRDRSWVDTWRTTTNRKHGYMAGCTFPSHCPVERIDYIMMYHGGNIMRAPEVRRAWVAQNDRVSDHCGVVVDGVVF